MTYVSPLSHYFDAYSKPLIPKSEQEIRNCLGEEQHSVLSESLITLKKIL